MDSSISIIIKQNWLTRKPNPWAFDFSFVIAFLLLAISATYLNDYFQAQNWLPANAEQVFNQHQYWRVWTTLLIHADWGHFLSNVFLFVPLTYLFMAYYGLLLPIIGLLIGGVINLLVLKTLPPETTLLGISGVVYWLGAAWLTLYSLVDQRESAKRRFARSVFLTVLLFTPEAYKPQVSYLSHFLGFAFGILSALAYYYFNRRKFEAAVVKEIVYDTSDSLDLEAQPEFNLDRK